MIVSVTTQFQIFICRSIISLSIIRAFFEELNPEYCVHYIDENVPLGTAGSLRYLKNIITETFFVSNCDILIEADYHEVLQHHFEKKNDITVVAALRNHNIPYGICEIQNGGTLLAINEKPEYSFLVNTGMYILNANTIDLIPRDTFFHITDLIESVKRRGGKVGVFPVSEKSWIDIGQWEEYRSALRQLEIH